jgi:hypothetical protein
VIAPPPPLPPLTPIERRGFDYAGLDAAMEFADAAMRTARATLATIARDDRDWRDGAPGEGRANGGPALPAGAAPVDRGGA